MYLVGLNEAVIINVIGESLRLGLITLPFSPLTGGTTMSNETVRFGLPAFG